MKLQCFYRYFFHRCSYGFTDSFTADITAEYYCDFKVNSVSVCRWFYQTIERSFDQKLPIISIERSFDQKLPIISQVLR